MKYQSKAYGSLISRPQAFQFRAQQFLVMDVRLEVLDFVSSRFLGLRFVDGGSFAQQVKGSLVFLILCSQISEFLGPWYISQFWVLGLEVFGLEVPGLLNLQFPGPSFLFLGLECLGIQFPSLRFSKVQDFQVLRFMGSQVPAVQFLVVLGFWVLSLGVIGSSKVFIFQGLQKSSLSHWHDVGGSTFAKLISTNYS